MANEKGDTSFDIEDMYRNFLDRISLTEGGMHPEQRKQIRQAFFGGISSTLALIKQTGPKLAPLEFNAGMDRMWADLGAYWQRRLKGGNS